MGLEMVGTLVNRETGRQKEVESYTLEVGRSVNLSLGTLVGEKRG